MLSHTGGTEQNKTFSTTKKHEFTRKKTKPMRWISLPVAISFTARGCSVVEGLPACGGRCSVAAGLLRTTECVIPLRGALSPPGCSVRRSALSRCAVLHRQRVFCCSALSLRGWLLWRACPIAIKLRKNELISTPNIQQ
jgi:hypothetical protein